MTETKFTVFCMDGYWPAGKGKVPADLFGAIEYAVSEDADYPPVAWAAEPVSEHGGTKRWVELRAESLAAGRTIELIDGKYVPRGVPVEDKPAKQEICPDCHGHTVLYCGTCGTTCKPTKERTRPALDWADSKRVDRWEGYVVYSDAVSSGFVPSATPAATHPLQRIAQEGDQLHGSAFLRKGA
jgi:hypothetical protein